MSAHILGRRMVVIIIKIAFRYIYFKSSSRQFKKGNIKINVSSRKDDVGDSWESAKKIVEGKTLQGSLDGAYDNDYYKFVVPENGTYEIYAMKGYVRSDLVKLDILINKEMVDALSFIVFKDSAYDRGRKMCERLKEEIPRHLFEIPIQAAVNGKVIARETVKAMRKDVLAKCYGGDISRKKKLLEKQKEGKKRMRQVGSVEVPQEAFMSVLKLDED